MKESDLQTTRETKVVWSPQALIYSAPSYRRSRRHTDQSVVEPIRDEKTTTIARYTFCMIVLKFLDLLFSPVRTAASFSVTSM